VNVRAFVGVVSSAAGWQFRSDMSAREKERNER
jgi:hypothetical protein